MNDPAKEFFAQLHFPVHEEDYPPGSSTISSLVIELAKTKQSYEAYPIRDIIIKLATREYELPNLSEFQVLCGVDGEYILTVLLTYLASQPTDSGIPIYGTININYIAWSLYHGIHDIEFHFNAINCQIKEDNEDKCVICEARINIVCFNHRDFVVTVSPKLMSADRHPMCFSFEHDSHYVIWSHGHRGELDVKRIRHLMQMDILPSGSIYMHGQPTYGHPHIHVISGDYHNIRAKETFHNCITAVLKGSGISCDDFFHPISSYYCNCDSLGRDYIIACFVLNIVRLVPGLSDYATAKFLKAAYRHTWAKVKCTLEADII